ncbi:MAG: hypothetical protein R3B59_04390 [Dehalococcoidia bacterium]
MATDAIREARTLLLEQRRKLRADLDRLTRDMERTDNAIAALEAVLGPLIGPEVEREATATGIPTTIRGKTNTRPFIARVLREHPGGHHVKQITEWVEGLIHQTAKNPVQANTTTLIRMQEQGLVRNRGNNVWEWIGGDAGESDPTPDSEESVIGGGGESGESGLTLTGGQG